MEVQEGSNWIENENKIRNPTYLTKEIESKNLLKTLRSPKMDTLDLQRGNLPSKKKNLFKL